MAASDKVFTQSLNFIYNCTISMNETAYPKSGTQDLGLLVVPKTVSRKSISVMEHWFRDRDPKGEI